MEGEALSALAPTLQQHGWVPLNEELSRALCVFDDDKIVGFMVFQMVPHCGPLIVDTQYRGSGIPEHLSEMMVQYVAGLDCGNLLVVPENKFSEALCKHHGMTLLDHPVYIMKRKEDNEA